APSSTPRAGICRRSSNGSPTRATLPPTRWPGPSTAASAWSWPCTRRSLKPRWRCWMPPASTPSPSAESKRASGAWRSFVAPEAGAAKDRLAAAVLISGNGSNLQAIIDHVRAAHLPCDIRLVVSNEPAAFGLERARRAGIPAEVLDHRRFPGREAFDESLAAILDRHGVEVVFLAGFMR